MEIKGILVEALNNIKRSRTITPRTQLEISALRWELYAALQNTLDAMAMVVADLGLRKPSSYADLGRVLYESSLIDEALLKVTRLIAITRSTLAHAYRRLGSEDLNAITRNVIPRLIALIRRLVELTESEGLDPESEEPETDKLRERLKVVFAKHNVLLAYLFGSRARGAYRKDSDYDIAALFKKDKVTALDEIELALDIAKALNVPSDKVDVIALNNADRGLMMRVLREGAPIYYEGEDELRTWERRTYLSILRETDLHATYMDRALRRAGDDPTRAHGSN